MLHVHVTVWLKPRLQSREFIVPTVYEVKKKIIVVYLKAFQSKEEWLFPFWYIIFHSRDIYVLVVCK